MIKQQPYESVASLIKPYPGKWVALTRQQDRVVAVASSPKVAVDKAHKNGEACPFLMKVPDGSIQAFIF